MRLEDIVPNFGVRQMVEHFARTRLSAQEPPPRSHHIASGERGAVETDAGDDIAEIVERSAEEAATERFHAAEQRGDVFDLTGSHETTEGAPPQRQAQREAEQQAERERQSQRQAQQQAQRKRQAQRKSDRLSDRLSDDRLSDMADSRYSPMTSSSFDVRSLPPRARHPPSPRDKKTCDVDAFPPPNFHSPLDGAVELNEKIPATIRLYNSGNEEIAFKIKTTEPRKYCVLPNRGFVKKERR